MNEASFFDYQIKNGDTLTRIAAKFGTTVDIIAGDNGLVNKDFIIAGRFLKIRSGSGARPSAVMAEGEKSGDFFNYVVQAGDNLSRIAERYDTTVDVLVSDNNIANKNLIFVGQNLRVRRSSSPAPDPVSSSSAMSKEQIEEIIRKVASQKGVDADLAVKVARCESGLNQYAKNVNKNGTIDRGIYQWNDYWHPDITDEMAYNPEIACELFCDAVLEGNLGFWSASKSCWSR